METPLMSVVLVTPDRYQRLRKTISYLAAQTRSSALEIVIVSPAELPDAQDERWPQFQDVKFVNTGPFMTSAHPRMAGIGACEAAIVSFGEDHCFPSPAWAEGLIGRYAEGWGAVGPVLKNANPGPVSWADFLLNFGSFSYPAASGQVGGAPWHNTSYRRELLCAYGDKLGEMLEAEISLQQDLIRRGHGIYLAGDVEVGHVNLSRWRSFLHCQMWGGRLYGSARAGAESWSVGRRLLYVAAFPAIATMRAVRMVSNAKRSMRSGWNVPFLVACGGGVLASSLGEVAGYALGAGRAKQIRLGYEFDRVRHLNRADRELLP